MSTTASPGPPEAALAAGAAGRRPQLTRRNRRLWFWLLAALVLVGGAGLRLAAWQEARGYAPRGDELDYVIPAETLTRTGRYVDTFISDGRTWTRVPGNSLLLAAAFATQPPVPATVTITDTAWMAPRLAAGNLAEIAVSLALLPLVMGLAAAAFPARRRRVALLAGALAAAYPPFIFSAAQTLLSETLFMTLICAALLALVRWAPRRAAWPWLVLAGGLLGLAALTRSAAVAFLPFLPFGFWLDAPSQNPKLVLSAANGSKIQNPPCSSWASSCWRRSRPGRSTIIACTGG